MATYKFSQKMASAGNGYTEDQKASCVLSDSDKLQRWWHGIIPICS